MLRGGSLGRGSACVFLAILVLLPPLQHSEPGAPSTVISSLFGRRVASGLAVVGRWGAHTAHSTSLFSKLRKGQGPSLVAHGCGAIEPVQRATWRL